jgi:hypothetical protein
MSTLSPADPQSELETLGVCVIGYRFEAVRELNRIGVPVANSFKPAGVYVVHLDTQRGGLIDHLTRQRIINVHSAAPTVVHQEGSHAAWDRWSQVALYPTVKCVAAVVHLAGVRPHEASGES